MKYNSWTATADCQKHWIVKSPDSTTPPPSGDNKRFSSYAQACKVASILASQNPGQRFTVYEAQEQYEAVGVTRRIFA